MVTTKRAGRRYEGVGRMGDTAQNTFWDQKSMELRSDALVNLMSSVNQLYLTICGILVLCKSVCLFVWRLPVCELICASVCVSILP